MELFEIYKNGWKKYEIHLFTSDSSYVDNNIKSKKELKEKLEQILNQGHAPENIKVIIDHKFAKIPKYGITNEVKEGTRCWKGYKKKGMKTMFGKRVPNCVKNEDKNVPCPACGDPYCDHKEDHLKEEEITSGDRNIALMLPRGEMKVLKAEDKDYDRGLLVTLLDDGGYDMAYWYEKHVPFEVEVLVDGKSIKKDAKVVTMKFHPELDGMMDKVNKFRMYDIEADIKDLRDRIRSLKEATEFVGYESKIIDVLTSRLNLMMKDDPKLAKQIADLMGYTLKKRIDKDGNWKGSHVLKPKKQDLIKSVESKLHETMEFAQDFRALMKGIEEDLANRDKEVDENLRAWFGKGKKGGAGGGGWDRYNTKGERIGKCGDSKKGEGKPKCLSKSRAASLRAKGGKKAIAAAVRKKRREDPNKNRKGKAKNVSNTTRKSKKKK